MQCVILAAGKGTRMRPLTDFRPKTLVKINERPVLDHLVEALPDAVDELIMVIGYRGDQVREHCKEKFLNRPVQYVEQENPVAGTANALLTARPLLKPGKFLVLMGDDLYGKVGLTKALVHNLCVIAAECDESQRYGVVVRKADGTLDRIMQGVEESPCSLVSTGAMILDERIFNYEAAPDPRTGEQYLPAMVERLAMEYPVAVEVLDKWYPIAYPGDIVVVERVLKEVSLLD